MPEYQCNNKIDSSSDFTHKKHNSNNKVQLTLEDIQNNFVLLVALVWKFLRLPKPTPVQQDIAKYLQHGPRRSIIEAFRGVGKSWLTSVFCIWLWLINPQFRIMVVSASKERADSFSIFTKRLISEMPLLAHLQPGRGMRDSNIAFDVGLAEPDHSPSLKSVGITGQLTGSRADIIIADDIETPKNSYTTLQRERLSELVKEFDAILKPLETSRIIYLGTPQTEASLYNELPERGYEKRIWPAEYPDEKLLNIYGNDIAPYIYERWTPDFVGEAVDPARFNTAELVERRISYGRSGYALQFMLNTSLSDAEKYPLKLEDLVVYNIPPEDVPAKIIWVKESTNELKKLHNVGFQGDAFYKGKVLDNTPYLSLQGTIMAIDPAGRGKDETAYAVIGFLNSQLYLLKAGGLDGGYSEQVLKTLSVIAKEFKITRIIYESNFGDGMFGQLLKPVLNRIHPCIIEEVRHHTQKEQRIIDILEPVMNRHKLIVDESVIKEDMREKAGIADPKQYMLFYQMTHITKERGALIHDDRLDALAMGVAYWVEKMDRDVDKMIEIQKQEAVEAELKSFLDHCLGRQQNKNLLSDYL